MAAKDRRIPSPQAIKAAKKELSLLAEVAKRVKVEAYGDHVRALRAKDRKRGKP